ncbi:MAG TPA: ABC transporter permease [Trebonia sp.]|nr:ABC transporter permease [Trebonia sp.]
MGRRLLILAASLFAASLLVFAILAVLPGSAAQVILGTQATPESVAQLSQQLGLDKPLVTQYLDWAGGLLRGDLGTSYVSSQPISALLGPAIEITGPLIVGAMIIGLLIAIPLGMASAVRSSKPSGTAITVASQLGIAIPTFVGGLLLAKAFALELHWLPPTGFPGWSAGAGPALKALVLPAVTLGLAEGAILLRFVRSSVLEVLRSDYYRTARAKGLRPLQALARHGPRNILIPLVTVFGLEAGGLIVGAIVVENVFVLPGVGSQLVAEISNRDLIGVQDIVLLASAVVLILNFLVDLSYRVLDPRVGGERA